MTTAAIGMEGNGVVHRVIAKRAGRKKHCAGGHAKGKHRAIPHR